jgi:hypothetical protein
MEYLLMCCINEETWAKIPEAQRNKIMREYGEWEQDIVKSGHFRGAAQLEPTSASTTIRHQNGKPMITDGPFAETKEQLGGYHLVECKDLDEAISIAARIPTLPFGGLIEVRPLVPASARLAPAGSTGGH